MGGEKDKISCFIKDEGTYSPSADSFNNYTLVGIRKNGESGSVEGGVAFKVTDNSYGGFSEVKLTTEEFAPNLSLESRTRLCFDKPYKSDRTNVNTTQRFAVKGSWDIDRNWNIYETAGVSLDYDLLEDELRTIGPTSVTGVGYKINKNTSLYGEVTLSRTYKPENETWNRLSSSVTLGVKIGF